MQLKLTHDGVKLRARHIARLQSSQQDSQHNHCYAVPRGGIPAAYLISKFLNVTLVDSPEKADFIVDDIIDSGATRARVLSEAGRNIPFYALVDKTVAEGYPFYVDPKTWVVFPWEGDADSGITDNIRRLIQSIGEDSSRQGLVETPQRVAKAMKTWYSGYDQDPAKVLKVFEDGAENYNEMVVVKDIPFYSHCEHHMAPFFGTVTIAYVPNKKIVGLSKLSRLVDIFARRLQVQERLTTQIVKALEEHLQPLGCGCVVKARHLCMESRGIEKQGHETVTSALAGKFRNDPTVRAEFLALAR